MNEIIVLGLLLVIVILLVVLRHGIHRRKQTALLLQVSLQLSSTTNRKQLIEKIMKLTSASVKGEGSSVLLVDEQTGELYFEVATGERSEQVKQIKLKKGEGIAGYVAEARRSLRINDVTKDERWSNRVAVATEVTTRNMLCVPVYAGDRLLGVLQVINKQRNKSFAKADLQLLEWMASPIAVALENMMLYEQLVASMEELRVTTATKERLESEMLIAKQIQQRFLPEPVFQLEQVALAAELIPAREVGGDFFHYAMLSENKLLVCLGDVSDKGMPAALFLASVMSWLKAEQRYMSSPAMLLQAINEELCSEESTMFATIFVGVLELNSGLFVYSNGGHCPPVLLRQKETKWLRGEQNLPLGVLPGTKYIENVVWITENDTILFYTDGITEAENKHGEWFGAQRLMKQLEKWYPMMDDQSSSQTPQSVVSEVVQSVQQFSEGVHQSDDIAVMAMQFTNRCLKPDKAKGVTNE
ncbi:SpoIIE family protein phosphatase [Paenibacillus yanchengensis]|uniref:SpoIIE family protein phosphatase n=1 Tax=Paenibacillus yanchengensis TaxID=2035833 RepID=A0ABW4YEV6_9BACL